MSSSAVFLGIFWRQEDLGFKKRLGLGKLALGEGFFLIPVQVQHV